MNCTVNRKAKVPFLTIRSLGFGVCYHNYFFLTITSQYNLLTAAWNPVKNWIGLNLSSMSWNTRNKANQHSLLYSVWWCHELIVWSQKPNAGMLLLAAFRWETWKIGPLWLMTSLVWKRRKPWSLSSSSQTTKGRKKSLCKNVRRLTRNLIGQYPDI